MMRRLALAAILPATFGALASCLPDPGVVAPHDGGTSRVLGSGGAPSGSGGGVVLTGDGGQTGSGAQVGGGTGGLTGSGGQPGSGGRQGTGGGGTGTGGRVSTGGTGTGGRVGTGGTATGGVQGTGGVGTGGAGTGGAGTGGAVPTACALTGSPNPGAGSFTFYNFGQGTATAQEGGGFRTACGYFGTETSGSGSDTVQNIATPTMFAAIPGQTPANFNSSGSCGACALVTNGGRSVTVTVVDECPQNSNPVCNGNPGGHLDLSVAAFNALGFPVGNPSGTTWRFVPCPVTGNVKIRMKTGNPNEIFIENELVPIRSVTLNGTAATRQSYGAWHFAANIPAGSTLTLVDAANRTITVPVASTTANLNQDTGRQFPACQ